MKLNGRIFTVALALISIFILIAPNLSGAEPPKERMVPEITWMLPSPGWRLEEHESDMLIARKLQAVGLKVNIKFAPNWVTFRKSIDDPWPFDIFSSGFNERPDRLEPDRILSEFSKEQIGKGKRNFYGYESAEYNKVLQKSREELDVKRRRKLISKAQEILVRDIPSIAVFHLKSLQPYDTKKWTNVQAGPGLGLFNLFNMTEATPKTSDKSIAISSVDVVSALNPLNVPSTNLIMMNKFVYDNLAAVTPESEVVPWAAESWKVLDSKTIDVTLRKGMKFHDGKPVTPEDIKFSFEYLKKYKVASYMLLVKPIAQVKVLDSRRVRFVLEHPFAPLLMTTFTTIPIVPKHIWENVVEREKLKHPDEWQNPRPIGSGPFKFDYIRPGEEIAFVRNPDHFRAPKVDAAMITFPANREAEFLMLKKGTVDFIDSKGLNPVRAKELAQTEHKEVIELGGISVHWIGFNLRDGHPTMDWNLRHAIAHLVPYDAIVKNILQGKGDAGAGFIAPANKFWHNFDLQRREVEGKVHIHQFGIEKARRILKDAGFEWDSSGRLYWPKNYKPKVLP